MGALVAVDEQLRVLTSGAIDVISEKELRHKLEAGRPLRVKLGIDPTASDIHLGFAVVLRKLRAFQDLGHRAVLIIGDFTARVGDPSGRSSARPRLSQQEVEMFARSYLDQVRRILDFADDRIEVRRNSEWLEPMGMDDVLGLASQTTVARMLERKDFAQRYERGAPISVMELLYPLLQGYDSVQVEADVELGGTDQLFNNLVGRQLQEQSGQEPQVVLTTPLLEGLDGVQKMSKSLGNAVGISEPPAEQFGKLMSLPDDLVPTYYQLATGWDPDRVEAVTSDLAAGRLAAVDAKRLLARTVVDLYHDPGTGEQAEAEFDRVFRDHERPSEIPEAAVERRMLSGGRIKVAKLLFAAGLVPSSKEGRRMIEQGAVRIDGERETDPDAELSGDAVDGMIVQVGRRRWARVRLA